MTNTHVSDAALEGRFTARRPSPYQQVNRKLTVIDRVRSLGASVDPPALGLENLLKGGGSLAPILLPLMLR